MPGAWSTLKPHGHTALGDGGTLNLPGMAKAWVNFGNPSTINDQFNVTSITKIGTGVYRLNFTVPLANANYVPIVTLYNSGTPPMKYQVTARTVNDCTLATTNDAGTATDIPGLAFVVVFGG